MCSCFFRSISCKFAKVISTFWENIFNRLSSGSHLFSLSLKLFSFHNCRFIMSVAKDNQKLLLPHLCHLNSKNCDEVAKVLFIIFWVYPNIGDHYGTFTLMRGSALPPCSKSNGYLARSCLKNGYPSIFWQKSYKISI